MVTMPPIIRELARDRQLNGRDMQIWVLVVPRLDFVSFRDLPLAAVAADFVAGSGEEPISRATVSRSLRRLVERGYLEAAENRGSNRAKQFRIPLRRIYPRRPIVSPLQIS